MKRRELERLRQLLGRLARIDRKRVQIAKDLAALGRLEDKTKAEVAELMEKAKKAGYGVKETTI